MINGGGAMPGIWKPMWSMATSQAGAADAAEVVEVGVDEWARRGERGQRYVERGPRGSKFKRTTGKAIVRLYARIEWQLLGWLRREAAESVRRWAAYLSRLCAVAARCLLSLARLRSHEGREVMQRPR